MERRGEMGERRMKIEEEERDVVCVVDVFSDVRM